MSVTNTRLSGEPDGGVWISRPPLDAVPHVGNATRVEGAQGQLRARFTDRLCSNDTHCFAHLHLATTGQVFAIALVAQPKARFTSQRIAYKGFLYPMPFDQCNCSFIQQVVALQHQLERGTA